MGGLSKRVRHAHRRSSLSSVLARIQYRGFGHEMCCLAVQTRCRPCPVSERATRRNLFIP
jgi:hypothetical protein